MKYEVEEKFYFDDLPSMERALHAVGSVINDEVLQIDIYFSHPCRDFAETDEAFRLRKVGERNGVTYKGPKIDQQTKTRIEIECSLPQGQAFLSDFHQLLEYLGFGIVIEVQKRRKTAVVFWEEAHFEVSLDRVGGLGEFVELETMAEAEEVDVAKAKLTSLARKLGLTQSERRSYCELLLLRDRPTSH